MRKKIIILGGGTGGTVVANKLRHALAPSDAEITVIDETDEHIYQPGLLFVPFGLARPEGLIRPRHQQFHGDGIEFLQSKIESVDIENNVVHLDDGGQRPYDCLVVASGCRILPGETPGMLGDSWNEDVFTFYSPEGATALSKKLPWMDHGRLVVNVVDMPIKCPVAPLEFCFLADWYFHEMGVRDAIEITYVTPLSGAFTKPIATEMLEGLLARKKIGVLGDFNTGEMKSSPNQLVGYDGRSVDFDLAVVVPLHGGAGYVEKSEGLGDALGFVPTDPHTLQSKVRENIFVIGDATDIPASKAGSVAHFEADVVCANVHKFLDGEPLQATYDGHVNCFIETGFDKALLIDFNYETEPLLGHFPSALGLPLLKESHINHLGKLMFEWFYWHVLLPGREVPGIGSAMPKRGKQIDRRTTA
jgi:sulfide:quinone oxidoreductase